MGAQQHGVSHPGAARWLVVILLSVIATCLILEVGLGTSAARAQVSTAQAGHIVAVAGQVSDQSYGLYLIDLKNGTLSVYQYVSSKRTLRLMASRNFTFDVQLDEYNTEPAPREIRKLVQQNKRLGATD